MVNKLQLSTKEANHKLRIVRQKLQRQSVPTPIGVLDLTGLDVEDGDPEVDVRLEFALLQERQRVEDDRLRRLVHGSGQGRPKSAEFEFAARTILATGCSARAAKDQILVAAGLFLPLDKFEDFEREVPLERWFRAQRKGLGYEAWVYAMLRVAKCESILQYGFDETSLDGTPTLNQWVLVQESTGAPSIITIECCGLMVGSTSEQIADHIRAAWITGQDCVDLVRQELGPVLADEYAPVFQGGVQLHKLQGVMHDTCNTANKTARLTKGLRDTSGQLWFGYDNWELLAEVDKPWFDFLCGNHTRNLPMDAFNKVILQPCPYIKLLALLLHPHLLQEFEAYIKRKLGEDLAAVMAECGDQTRVEASGVLLLRSMCKLTHKGHLQYAKGDGFAFADYLLREWPLIKNRCVGRAEHSKRQDWICEASWKFHNLLEPIIGYTVSTVLSGPNILRDSVLTRLENLHYEAYVHCCACMWKCLFK